MNLRNSSVGRDWMRRGAIAAIGAVAIALSFLLWDDSLTAWAADRTYVRRDSGWSIALNALGKGWGGLWLMLLWGWAGGRRRLVVAALLASILTVAVVSPSKRLTQRPRPDRRSIERPVPPKTIESYGDLSFPSGEATFVFSMAAVASAHCPPPLRAPVFLVAGAVALMRVFVVAHYLSDVIAGALLGALCGWLGLHLARKLDRPGRRRRIRRSGAGFWIVALLPLLNVRDFADDSVYPAFFKHFGPLVGCALLATKAPAWIAWLRGRRFGPPSPNDTPARRARAGALVMTASIALTVAPTLSSSTLFDSDEGFYAESAREMLERGDFIVPHVAGEPWLEKPPLTFWFMAAGIKLFGPTAFAARLPSTLFGLLAIWMTFRLAARMFSPLAGGLAALVLASAQLFSVTMRMAMLDAALVCCAILSMEGLWDFVQGRKRRGWALFFIGCGVGALAKGPLGAALPVAALVGYAAFARNWRILLDIRPFSGAALSLAIFGLWAVPALVVTRGDYFIELVWVRTIQPVFSPLQGHGGSNLGSYLALLPIYVPVVFLGLWTWSPFLVSAARDLKSAGDDREGARLLAGWIVGQFVLMSLVSTKLLHYVLPFFPALAIVIGRYLAQMAGAPGGLNAAMRRFGVKGFVGPTLALAALMLAAPFATGFAADWPWFALTAVVAAACAIALLRQLRRGAGARAPAWIAVGALLPIAFLFSFSLPRFDRGKAPARLAQFLHSHYGEVGLDRVAVGLRRYRENSFMYYLNRTAEKVETDRMREFLDRPTPAVIVVPGRYLRDAEADGFDYPYTVIWSEMTWVAGRNRWERLLAISNGLMPAVEGQIERASSDSSGRARSIRMQVNAPSVIVTSADSR